MVTFKRYEPQKNFYSDPIDKYLYFRQQKDKLILFIKRCIKWIFIIVLPLCFISLFVWTCVTHESNIFPHDQSDGMLGGYGIFTILVHALQDFFWMFVLLFGMLCYWIGEIFTKVGGSDLLTALGSNDGIKYWIGIITGVAVLFFVLMLIVRSVKIAHAKDSDEGHAMAKSTPGIVFWSITTMVIIPMIWLFITSIVVQLINAVVGGGNIAIQLFKASWENGVPPNHDFNTWKDIESVSGSWLMDAGANHQGYSFNVFICLVAWIGGTICSGFFAWYALSLIMNLLLCYIILFPAVAKWPQDEGGSAEAIRTEMVGNFIHLFALYFFFTIISIVIAAISGLGQVLGLSGFGTGIFQMLFIFVACFSAFKFTHKSSSFFQAKNQVSYTSFNEAGVTKAGAYGKGKIDDWRKSRAETRDLKNEAKAHGFENLSDYQKAQDSAQLRAGEKLKLEHNTDAIAKHLKSSGVADGEKARILAKGTMARHDKSVSKSIIMKQSGAIK